jgi:exodeoxyribonuclease-3
MKLLTWNVNGLRAIRRKGAWDELLKLETDVICLQEIKSEADQLTKDQRQPDGYDAWFNSSDERKGYSGTAMYLRQGVLDNAEVTIGIPNHPEFSTEGRVQTLISDQFCLVNCYFPQGGRPGRLEFKLAFYDAFLAYVEELKLQHNLPVMFCGDVNTAHHEIDLARPKANAKNTGFLPEERDWLDQLVGHGWTDVYRHYFPTQADMYTYWDQKTRARDRNVGWRIDYWWVNQKALNKISNVEILTDFQGSDHCPVVIEMK